MGVPTAIQEASSLVLAVMPPRRGWAAKGATVLGRAKGWLLAMLENRQGEASADFLRVAPVPLR
jgi:hypothetical protein